jgi:hypothetical protein
MQLDASEAKTIRRIATVTEAPSSEDDKDNESVKSPPEILIAPVVHPLPPAAAARGELLSTRRLEREVSEEGHRCWLTCRLYFYRAVRYCCVSVVSFFVGRWSESGRVSPPPPNGG